MNKVLLQLVAVLALAPVMAAAAVNGEADREPLEERLERLERRLAIDGQTAPQGGSLVSDSVVHLAGYGVIGFSAPEDGDGAFDTIGFNPIFHYQYKDRVLFEAELEIETAENGETETALEYGTIDWFLGNNAILIFGKFLSPLGYFRQNLHPAWINKLPSAPAGFGHDGAAPAADVGAQLRGGFKSVSGARFNYAIYAANGPELEAEGGEIHAIETEGYARNEDGSYVLGGRIGWLPYPELEIGVSTASGETSITVNDEVPVSGDSARDYDVVGADFVYHFSRSLEFRGEYIAQEVGEAPTSVVTDGGEWKAWYTQAAYRFGGGAWETVVRVGEVTTPHEDKNQEQWVFGINYLISPNTILKLAYESNDGLQGSAVDENRVLLQAAFGF